MTTNSYVSNPEDRKFLIEPASPLLESRNLVVEEEEALEVSSGGKKPSSSSSSSSAAASKKIQTLNNGGRILPYSLSEVFLTYSIEENMQETNRQKQDVNNFVMKNTSSSSSSKASLNDSRHQHNNNNNNNNYNHRSNNNNNNNEQTIITTATTTTTTTTAAKAGTSLNESEPEQGHLSSALIASRSFPSGLTTAANDKYETVNIDGHINNNIEDMNQTSLNDPLLTHSLRSERSDRVSLTPGAFLQPNPKERNNHNYNNNNNNNNNTNNSNSNIIYSSGSNNNLKQHTKRKDSFANQHRNYPLESRDPKKMMFLCVIVFIIAGAIFLTLYFTHAT